MGYSRDSFHGFKELYNKGAALQEIPRRKPLLRNRVAPAIERAVVEIAIAEPAWGQVQVANEPKRRALNVSAAGVRCVWQRHNLETMQKRLKALEAGSAQEEVVVSEGQLAALEKNQGRQGGARRVRERMRRLLWCTGHLLRWHGQGRGGRLPIDLPRWSRQEFRVWASG